MNKKKLISELERFIDYVSKTQLTKEDGIDWCGYTEEEIKNYPPGAPGIYPYFDSEIEYLEVGKSFLHWAKTGVFEFNPKLMNNHFKCEMNFLNYIRLYPEYDVLLSGECGRGFEILLALCEKDTWKKIYCYDYRGLYEKFIYEFFDDPRIVFFQQQSCYFDLNLLTDNNIMMILTHSLPHALENFINCPNITMIIKEGCRVDQNKLWKEHNPAEMLESEYEKLRKLCEQYE